MLSSLTKLTIDALTVDDDMPLEERVELLEQAVREREEQLQQLRSREPPETSKLEERVQVLRQHLLEREQELEELSLEAEGLREAAGAGMQEMEELRRLREEREAREEALVNLEGALEELTQDYKRRVEEREQLVREALAGEAQAKQARMAQEFAAREAELRRQAQEWKERAAQAEEKEDSWRRRAQMAESDSEPLREALQAAMEKLQALVETQHFAVDRRVVASLVTTFFDRSKSSAAKADVLRLLVNILRLTPEQKEVVSSSGWWQGAPSQADHLGDEFVHFLERESEST